MEELKIKKTTDGCVENEEENRRERIKAKDRRLLREGNVF